MDKNREDFIKKIAINQQKANDLTERQDQLLAKKSEQLRLRQKNTLDESGIREFFEDIIAEGSIRLSDKPSIEEIFVKRRFRNDSKKVKENILSKYTPARIEECELQKNNALAISLLYNSKSYNESYNNNLITSTYYETITFYVFGETISLVSLEIERKTNELPIFTSSNYVYTPFNNNLEELITRGFKYSIPICYSDANENTQIFLKKLSLKEKIEIFLEM